MASQEELDNAAQAALDLLGWMQDPKIEHLGALYSTPGGINRTDTVSTGQSEHVGGKLSVPAGSLLGLFHNHPEQSGDRNAMKNGGAAMFSPDDKAQATRLHIPSYISTPDGRTRRFDPATNKTEDVLAEFPINEFKTFLMKKLLNRAPDDPRGLYLERQPETPQ